MRSCMHDMNDISIINVSVRDSLSDYVHYLTLGRRIQINH